MSFLERNFICPDKMNELLKNPQYRFFTDNQLLNDNLILATYGGSYAYGTNVETSDVDIRGIVLNPVNSLLGNYEFEQFEDRETDTIIYGLNKIVKLLLNCNPNVCESVGCRPQDYFVITEEGQRLIDNRNLFLSKRAINSFGGYANAQLRRLQNALARDKYSQSDKEKHIFGSISHAMDSIVNRYHTVNGEVMSYDFTNDKGAMVHAYKEYNNTMKSFEDKFSNFEYGQMKLYPDKAENEEMDVEIFCDVALHHYPLRDYKNIWNELNVIVKDYDKLGKRNTKKDDAHLNKHAMHLIRLYYMCIDILEKEEIITYRKDEHDLLMSIRNGAFQKEDGTYRSEFFELVDELEKHMSYAAEHTNLPDQPNYEAVQELLIDINRNYIARTIK